MLTNREYKVGTSQRHFHTRPSLRLTSRTQLILIVIPSPRQQNWDLKCVAQFRNYNVFLYIQWTRVVEIALRIYVQLYSLRCSASSQTQQYCLAVDLLCTRLITELLSRLTLIRHWPRFHIEFFHPHVSAIFYRSIAQRTPILLPVFLLELLPLLWNERNPPPSTIAGNHDSEFNPTTQSVFPDTSERS